MENGPSIRPTILIYVVKRKFYKMSNKEAKERGFFRADYIIQSQKKEDSGKVFKLLPAEIFY